MNHYVPWSIGIVIIYRFIINVIMNMWLYIIIFYYFIIFIYIITRCVLTTGIRTFNCNDIITGCTIIQIHNAIINDTPSVLLFIEVTRFLILYLITNLKRVIRSSYALKALVVNSADRRVLKKWTINLRSEGKLWKIKDYGLVGVKHNI